MNIDEMERIAGQGESDRVEFKKSTAELTRAGQSLCAFLNGGGGSVLIGVSPSGKITGQDVGEETHRDVAALLRRLEPPAHVDVRFLPVAGGRQVIILTAEAPREGVPWTFEGRPYQRTGRTTSVMPQERYQALLIERAHSRRRWENEPATGITLDDVDQEEVLRTLRLGVEAGRIPESTRASRSEVLSRLGLVVEGSPVNAAVVLFGKRFLPGYPQCQLRLARFRGTGKSEFQDQRQLEGSAFQILDEAMLFLRRHLPVAGRVLPGLFERADEPLFPVVALREALVNAVCHRDYSIPGGALSVGVYDDRTEIWSDGTLPFGLHVSDLKRDHPSRPRNPIVAGVLYRRGLVERWGRGTQRIVELSVLAGHPEPEFIQRAGALCVRFLPSGYVAPTRVAHDLTDRQRSILQFLDSAGAAPLRAILSSLQPASASRALRDDLYHLQRLGLIATKGRGRGAVWVLSNPPRTPSPLQEGAESDGMGRNGTE
jgi:ATP-dependent DNA helicase RecG